MWKINNKIKILILGLVFFALILPRPVFAVLGTGIFDYFMAVFEGVEEKAGPISSKMILMFFLYAVGLLLLAASSGFLDIILSHPEWLSIRDSGFVQAGFNFTSGLANMLVILIFIVIAFAFILKIETLQFKKALPKLIIVALLLNFSLVFVGMLVDVSNVLYGAIMENMITPDGSILLLVFERLIGGASSVLANLTAWIGSLALTFAIPFVGPFAQLALVLGLAAIFLPNILVWIFQIILMYLLSGVLFLIVFFFAARIFVVQILAILSPLAFLCLILPQTEKHWKEWLQHLIEWIFVGLLVLFFLVLGLLTIQYLIPGVDTAPVPYPIVGWARLEQYFVYYFFLFIYFLIVAWFSQKTMPVLGKTLIEGATSWGSRVAMPLGKEVSKQLRRSVGRGVRSAWTAPGKPGGLKERTKERMKEWAQASTPELKGAKALLTPVAVPFWAIRRGLGRQLAIAPLEAERKEIREGKERAEKIETPELALSEFREALGAHRLAEALGLLSKSIEKGGGFKKMIEKELKTEEATRLAQYANRIGAVPEAERIGRLFSHQEKVIERMGFKPLIDEDKAKGYENIQQKLIGEAKGDEVKDFAKEFWTNEEAAKAIHLFWGGPQLRKAAEEFGASFTSAYSERIDKRLGEIKRLPADEAEREFKAFVHANPRRSRYLETTAAQEFGFTSIHPHAPESVKAKYKNIREILAETPAEKSEE